MAEFIAPLDNIRSQLKHAAGVHGIFGLEAFAETTDELADAVLDEAAKFAERVLAPINRLGDRQGAHCTGDVDAAESGVVGKAGGRLSNRVVPGNGSLTPIRPSSPIDNIPLVV
jgi:hypothetical protein